MRRLMAIACTGLLALSAPVSAFAQSNQAANQGYGAGDSGAGNQSYGAGDQGAGNQGYGAGDQAANGTSGTDALAQAPGFGNVSPFLIIGGIAGGAGLIAYAVSQNNNDNGGSNPVSP